MSAATVSNKTMSASFSGNGNLAPSSRTFDDSVSLEGSTTSHSNLNESGLTRDELKDLQEMLPERRGNSTKLNSTHSSSSRTRPNLTKQGNESRSSHRQNSPRSPLQGKSTQRRLSRSERMERRQSGSIHKSNSRSVQFDIDVEHDEVEESAHILRDTHRHNDSSSEPSSVSSSSSNTGTESDTYGSDEGSYDSYDDDHSDSYSSSYESDDDTASIPESIEMEVPTTSSTRKKSSSLRPSIKTNTKVFSPQEDEYQQCRGR